jgi:hypothetical protein
MKVFCCFEMRKLNQYILNFSHFVGSYSVHKSFYLTVNEPFLVGVRIILLPPPKSQNGGK